jgi:hypothetical protein
MNKIIVMMWIDQKKAEAKRNFDMGFTTVSALQAQILLLEQFIDDFNLETVHEDVDYTIQKNF